MPLDEVCNVEYGTRVVRRRDGGGIYPVYGGGGASFQMDDFNREDRLVISRFGMSEECTRFVTGRFFLNDSGLTVSPRNGALLPKFLDYQMLSLNDGIYVLGKGAAQKNLDVPAFRKLPLVVPSDTKDQKRIVGILDKAFDSIATAKANGEKNLHNARALFESHLQSVFINRGDGWVEKRLGDLSRINYGYTESASWEKIGPKFLRITDIQANRVDWSRVPSCPIESRDLPKYRLADGDIVFARTGATTGKSYLVTDPPEAVFASYLIRVQLYTKELLPQFVNLFFQTRSYWDSVRSGVSGSAQGGFNATKLGDLVIPFPKLQKEQQSIIAELDKIATGTNRLESIYQKKVAALDELKKALLHEAFTGEL